MGKSPTSLGQQDGAGDGTHVAGRAPGTPRWVKLLALAGLIAVVAVVIAMLVAGGQHGPGMHMPGGGASPTQALPSRGPGTAAGVGGPASADDAARTIQVTTLDTLSFEPNSIEVSAGRRSRLS
jgi:hypothetical protein